MSGRCSSGWRCWPVAAPPSGTRRSCPGRPRGPARSAPGPLEPARYAALHHAAGKPGEAGWDAALDELAARGDDFTLAHLDQLDPAALQPEQRARLARATEALRHRQAAATAAEFGDGLAVRLERAA